MIDMLNQSLGHAFQSSPSIIRHSASGGMHGRKRKANDNLDARPTQRARRNDEPFLDESHVFSTLTLPTKEDYPDAPHKLFDPRYILDSLHALIQKFGLSLRPSVTVAPDHTYRCTLQGSLADNQAVVFNGDGMNKVKSTLPRQQLFTILTSD